MARRTYGSGSYKRNSKGKYVVQVSAGKDATGKRIRITRTANTSKEATALLKALQDEIAAAESTLAEQEPSEEPLLTADLFERWYTTKAPAWSARTRELYRHQLDAHAIPSLGNILLTDLKPLDIQKMVNKIVKDGKIATANKVRSMVSSALKQAVRWELIGRNPADAVDPVPEKRRPLNVWTPQQARAFLEHHKNHRFYAAYYLLITSGIRRGELLGLRRQDIVENGIYIRQTVTLVDDVPTIGRPKTKNSERFVTLPEDTLQVLREHLARLDETIALVGDAWEHPELVFPSETGTLMHGRNFYRTWQLAVKAAGLPHTRIHDQRHLHATLLIDQGEDSKVISDRLGHASVSFTLDRYGHLYNERRQRAAHTLDTLLGPEVSEESDRSSAEDDSEQSPGTVGGEDGGGALYERMPDTLPLQLGR